MGLHCGYLVAAVEPDALLAELSRHAGVFAAGAVVERVADADIDDRRFDLLLGGGDGRAFLLDTSMALSDSPDMIIAMSPRWERSSSGPGRRRCPGRTG